MKEKYKGIIEDNLRIVEHQKFENSVFVGVFKDLASKELLSKEKYIKFISEFGVKNDRS